MKYNLRIIKKNSELNENYSLKFKYFDHADVLKETETETMNLKI